MLRMVKYLNTEVSLFGVPDDVRFLATDAHGDCWAFRVRPVMAEEERVFDLPANPAGTDFRQNAFFVTDMDMDGIDWRQTLVELPERWWETSV